MMDLRALRYFVATVESGSISAAATSCFVAQPSITMAIAKLEDEFGCKLFHRHRKGSTPTPDGEKMYKLASDLLNHADSIKSEFSTKDDTPKIHISVDQNIRISILDAFLCEAFEKQPGCQFEIINSGDREATAIDLRLTSKSTLSATETFISLAVERYALMIPLSNVLAYQTKLTPADLQFQNVISRIHCENLALFEQTIDTLGLDINIVAKVESEEWAHALVGAGLGVTIAPINEEFEDPRLVCRPLSEIFSANFPEREIGLAIRNSALGQIRSLLPHRFSDE